MNSRKKQVDICSRLNITELCSPCNVTEAKLTTGAELVLLLPVLPLPTMPVMEPATLCVVGLAMLAATSLEGDWVTREAPEEPGTMVIGLPLVITGLAKETVTLLTPPVTLFGAAIFVMVAKIAQHSSVEFIWWYNGT